jgi:GWxTD domain-containing protein
MKIRLFLLATLAIPLAAQPALDARYTKWLSEDAAYLITDAEWQSWKQLVTDTDRDQFIDQFWTRRGAGFKQEHYRRIAYANQRFASTVPGWKTDRGRIYIKFGPADQVEAHPSGESYDRPTEQGGGRTATYPFEKWRFHSAGAGPEIIFDFVDSARTGEYRLVP